MPWPWKNLTNDLNNMYYTSNLTNNIFGKLHSWGKCDIITDFGGFWDDITYAEIFDWFIENNIWIAMHGGNMWDWRIIAKDRCMTIGTTLFKTFQEAADDAIERAMRILDGREEKAPESEES